MARIIDENFEGTGYEESWSETVTAGNTLDEDATMPGDVPPGGGSQCLKVVVISGAASAYALRTLTNQNISYIRDYLKITEEGLNDGQALNFLTLRDSANSFVANINVIQNSGVIQARYSFWSGGAQVNSAFVNINLNQLYRFEFKYDITNLLWEWKIDGATQQSGSLTAATRTPDRLRCGVSTHTGSAQSTIYEDLVVWDDAGWVGAESGGAKFPTPHLWWSEEA